ncbi:hypothetical protein LSTR_LSTR005805 [Laodelphax striatellus]|uniref:Uncharacterized protein n=1 Tax=Laodelphax striatellus TaxID=195883 RepID=A0A482X008_LAOST|nr:hypothetical protein LSTR_LSTR005805 [Laodelphax striatellus]
MIDAEKMEGEIDGGDKEEEEEKSEKLLVTVERYRNLNCASSKVGNLESNCRNKLGNKDLLHFVVSRYILESLLCFIIRETTSFTMMKSLLIVNMSGDLLSKSLITLQYH